VTVLNIKDFQQNEEIPTIHTVYFFIYSVLHIVDNKHSSFDMLVDATSRH